MSETTKSVYVDPDIAGDFWRAVWAILTRSVRT